MIAPVAEYAYSTAIKLAETGTPKNGQPGRQSPAPHGEIVPRAVGYTGQRAGDLPPVFDLERMDDGSEGCPTYASVSDAKAWLDTVEAAFGRKPVIYTQKSFLDDCLGSTTAFAAYPLQLADYRRSVTEPPLPNGSSTWLMWQYTDAALFDGIAAPATADLFNGSQADLDRLANR